MTTTSYLLDNVTAQLSVHLGFGTCRECRTYGHGVQLQSRQTDHAFLRPDLPSMHTTVLSV